jgi:hypothetical protein
LKNGRLETRNEKASHAVARRLTATGDSFPQTTPLITQPNFTPAKKKLNNNKNCQLK